MKVPKKPLASWMPLVAIMSVPICARIVSIGRIGAPSSLADWDDSTRSGLPQPHQRSRVSIVGRLALAIRSRSGRGWRAPAPAAQQLAPALEKNEEGRNEENADECRCDHAAPDRDAQGPSAAGAGSGR